MRGWKFLVVAVGTAAGVVGCVPEKPSDVVAAEELEIEADEDALEDSEAVVARVDGEEVTREEFDRRVGGLAEFARVRLQSEDDREELLGRIAEFEVLADVAEREGYGTSAEVRHAMKETMVALMIDDYLREEVSMADIDAEAGEAYLEARRTLVEGLTAEADVEVWDERLDGLDEIAPAKRDEPLRIGDIPLEDPGESY